MKEKNTVYRVAFAGLLGALCAALSLLEGVIPAVPLPGARWGLANIVMMFALTEVSLPLACGVTAVKMLMALLRGGTAFLMSAGGSGLSLMVSALLWRFGRNRISLLGLGIAGALAHNSGQLLVARLLLGAGVWYYAPWLLLMALISGTVTGLLLQALLPLLHKIQRKGC